MDRSSGLDFIPRLRRVYKATYANLPTSGLREGDLGYATDRLVFYRWSGAAWEAVTIHSSSGTAANIPAAADMPEGSIYFETDTTLLKQVQSGAWATIIAVPAALIVSETEVFNGTSPTAWTDLDLSGTIGANVALIVLKVKIGAASEIAVRKNGDTDEFYSPANHGGAAFMSAAAANVYYVFVVCSDDSGIIEWRTSVAETDTIDIIGYVE